MSSVSHVLLRGRGAVSPAARRAQSDRWFFSGTAVAQIALIVWGFAPSYYLKAAFGAPPLSALLHVHGALFTTWLVLLFTQTSLVAAKRTPVHRRLGVAGGVLAVAMVVVGYLAGIDAVRRGSGSALPGITPEGFLIVPLGGIAVFAGLCGAALALRRRPDYHKRFMTLATAELMSAGVARIPLIAAVGPVGFLGVPDMFVVAMAGYDLFVFRRIHPATWMGGLVLVSTQGLRLWAATNPEWIAIATWLSS